MWMVYDAYFKKILKIYFFKVVIVKALISNAYAVRLSAMHEDLLRKPIPTNIACYKAFRLEIYAARVQQGQIIIATCDADNNIVCMNYGQEAMHDTPAWFSVMKEHYTSCQARHE